MQLASVKSVTRVLGVFSVAALSVAITGCGMGTSAMPTSLNISAIKGRAIGGHPPVNGSVVTLYKAGKTGYGSAAISLGSGTTDAGGNFTITRNTTTCADPDQLYMIASGGDAGAGVDNPAAVLAIALGSCSTVNPSTFVIINEATTAAAAYALSGFANVDGSSTDIGTSSSNTAGLQHAFANALDLVDLNGNTRTTTVNGRGIVPAALINTVANALAQCVNSNGTASTGCTAALQTPPTGSATTPVKPANTWQGALEIALYPANQVSSIYTAGSVAPAFYNPFYNTQPTDFSLAIPFTAGFAADGTTAAVAPVGIAADASGEIWVSGMTGAPLAEFNYDGTILSPAGGFGDATFQALTGVGQVAVDTTTTPNVWTTWMGTAGTTPVAGNVYQFSQADGSLLHTYAAPTSLSINSVDTPVQSTPYSISVDPTTNNIWYATNSTLSGATATNNTFNTVVLSGTNYTMTSSWAVSPLQTPAAYGSVYMGISQTGFAWTGQSSSPLSLPLGTVGKTAPLFMPTAGTTTADAAAASSGGTSAQQVVFDGAISYFAATGSPSTASGRLSKYATPTSSINALASPSTAKTTAFTAAAIDGTGKIFVVATPFTPSASNSTSLTEFNSKVGTNGTYITAAGSAGYAPSDANEGILLNQTVLKGVAIDTAGAIWLANSTATATYPLVKVLGLAAPTKVIAAQTTATTQP